MLAGQGTQQQVPTFLDLSPKVPANVINENKLQGIRRCCAAQLSVASAALVRERLGPGSLLLSGWRWHLEPQAGSTVCLCSAPGMGTKGGDDSRGRASSSMIRRDGVPMHGGSGGRQGCGQTLVSCTLLSRGCWQSCISAVFELGQEERLPGLGVQDTSSALMSPDDRWSAAAQSPGHSSPQ